jgi:hypothetical protein
VQKKGSIILDSSEHGKNWQKLTDFQILLGYFYVFQVVEHTPDSFRTITLKKSILQTN